VKGIREDDAASVRAGKMSVVLLRVNPRLDNVPVTPVDEALGPDRPFIILRADIDRREAPRAFRSFSPSPEAAVGNWVYYLVPSGEYWLDLQGRFDTVAGPPTRFPPNGFFLEVPVEVPFLYAGTLSVSCRSRWGIFGPLVDRCGDVVIEDESDAAGAVVRRDLGGLGPVETVLLRSPTARAVPKGQGELAPMGVSLKGSLPLSTPEWKKRGVGRATGLGAMTTETLQNVSGGPVSYGGFLEAGVVLGYALYLPFGTAAGLIGGEHSSGKWGPCMKTIAGEVVGWSPRDSLRAAVVESLARRGVGDIVVVENVPSTLHEGPRPRPRTLFEVEIQEVVFRECGERWTFCAEMKLRGRLRDLARGRILYDGILIYSSGSRRSSYFDRGNTMPYEWLVTADAACRPIEEFCAPDGSKRFVGDLEAAARYLAERLVAEAGVAPGPGERGGGD
jgi:hypothetical protein